jgi:hypothetical protein
LGLHLNTGKTFANPHFEIRILNDDEKTTTLGGMIEGELAKLSSDAFSRRVNFASVDDEGNLEP